MKALKTGWRKELDALYIYIILYNILYTLTIVSTDISETKLIINFKIELLIIDSKFSPWALMMG